MYYSVCIKNVSHWFFSTYFLCMRFVIPQKKNSVFNSESPFRDETEPLKANNQPNGETQMSVEYEGGKVYTKPGTITGKHSAV